MLDVDDSNRSNPVSYGNMLMKANTAKERTIIPNTAFGSGLGIEFRQPVVEFAGSADNILRVGLIDSHQFSQECLVKAFGNLHPKFTMLPFLTIQDCILQNSQAFDVILHYTHASEEDSTKAITLIRNSFRNTPLIVLSDAEDADQFKAICSALKQGAQGFIPTRTMGIPMIAAAIHFVNAGGTFAPLDLLLSSQPEPVHELPATEPNGRLTSRQVMVLGHLQQGKANKIIAHELGMSESTVKVHVRNIMRKMGATNRTQAAYKAQSFMSASARK